MKTKLSSLAAVALVFAHPAFAQSVVGPVPPPVINENFFGNTTVTGAKACSMVNGIFPVEVTYSFSTASTIFYLKVLIENPPLSLPLQYLTAIVGPSPSYSVFDPELFRTSALVTGTYTGAPSVLGNVLTLGTTATPLVLTQTVTGTAVPCVLSFTGQQYYSP